LCEKKVVRDGNGAKCCDCFSFEKKSTMEIVRLLKHLKINETFMHHTIKRSNETGSMNDRPRSGHPKSATTKKIVKNVEDRIRRNPRRSANEMPKHMEISFGSMQGILEKDRVHKPYKHQKLHELTAKQKKVRRTEPSCCFVDSQTVISEHCVL
jgi:hypothetical protein